MHIHRTEPRAAFCFGLLLAAGCGAGKQTEFPNDPIGTLADGGEDVSRPGPMAGADAGPAEQFTGVDAASAGTFDCKPGTYAGTFETKVSTDAGGVLFSLFSFNFKGTMSIIVVGEVSQGAGEVPQTTYSIAPGAKLIGSDQTFHGSYVADLTGQLDCATKTFTGMVSDGVYTITYDAGSLPLQGALTGQYGDGDGGVPELHGTMTLDSPKVATLAANGTWTASLQ